MTQYNILNVKLFNSQLNKVKFAIKNGTEVSLNLSSNMIINSNEETNFAHKLLLTDTQVSNIQKAFGNGSSSNPKFSKTQQILSRGIAGKSLAVMPQVMLLLEKELIAAKLAEKATECYINKGIDELNKNLHQVKLQE